MFGADHEHVDVIVRPVDAGAPIEVGAEWGAPALQLAAGNGRRASVRRLLQRRADPNLRDERGRAPLELCVTEHGDLDSLGHGEVEVILDHCPHADLDRPAALRTGPVSRERARVPRIPIRAVRPSVV